MPPTKNDREGRDARDLCDVASRPSLLVEAVFTLFLMLIRAVISVFTDIFRSRDLSGWSKALWTLFILFPPPGWACSSTWWCGAARSPSAGTTR